MYLGKRVVSLPLKKLGKKSETEHQRITKVVSQMMLIVMRREEGPEREQAWEEARG